MKGQKWRHFCGIVAAVLFFSGCQIGNGNTFVAVTGITGVPVEAEAGTALSLTGTVVPDNATNQTIEWTVADPGTTGAVITGNTLNTEAAGTVIVTATIAGGLADRPFARHFSITITANEPFIAVTGINGVPVTAAAGTALTLTGTVVPPDATNKTIVWTVANAGTTGATITGGNLNTVSAGTVSVTAAIAGGLESGPYTQSFNITVQQPESFSISFEIINAAPSVTGPVLFLSSANGITTSTLTAENPGQYSIINWYITGTPVTGSGPSFTLNSSNPAYNRVGTYFLTIEVFKDGIPYSQTVTFEIRP